MNESNEPMETRGWDAYWQGTNDTNSYSSNSAKHPAIKAYWNETLTEALRPIAKPRIVDIASGGGAMIDALFDTVEAADAAITCVDLSAAAIENIHRTFPAVVGIVADAASIPLESSSYDLVMSQFGLEYAGMDAVDESSRLVAPGGVLALLMHIRPGLIYNECRAARDAVRRVHEAAFLERSLRFFEAGFAAVRGASRKPYEEAAKELNPAVKEMESIMSDNGEGVAGGKIARLYSDVERFHSRIQYYDPKEVIEWLRTMRREFREYEARMASMCEAAVDRKMFERVKGRLQDNGLSIKQARPLQPSNATLPLAWSLRAVRTAC